MDPITLAALGLGAWLFFKNKKQAPPLVNSPAQVPWPGTTPAKPPAPAAKPPVVKPPAPTSDPILRIGMKGADVASWQAFLGLPTTGNFDATMDAAVRKYQQSRGLAADGVIGPATWAARRAGTPASYPVNVAPGAAPPPGTVMTPSVAVPAHQAPASLPKPPSPAPSQAAAHAAVANQPYIVMPQTGPALAEKDRPTLRQGAKGQDVVDLQRALGLTGSDVDGQFGPHTKAVVIGFQKTHLDQYGKPLAPDGVVGPATWGALYRATQAGGA